MEVYDYWGIKEQDERGRLEYVLKARQQQSARKMLADGLDTEILVKYTGLSTEEMAALAEEEERQRHKER